MKKLMMLAAMVAMVMMLASPALADHRWWHDDDFDRDFPWAHFFDRHHDNDDDAPVVEQSFEQEAESGDVDLSYALGNSGDNSNICAPALQFGNTGNLQNAQGFVQVDSETDDITFEGSSFTFEPSLEAECDQSIEQAAVVVKKW